MYSQNKIELVSARRIIQELGWDIKGFKGAIGVPGPQHGPHPFWSAAPACNLASAGIALYCVDESTCSSGGSALATATSASDCRSEGMAQAQATHFFTHRGVRRGVLRRSGRWPALAGPQRRAATERKRGESGLRMPCWIPNCAVAAQPRQAG